MIKNPDGKPLKTVFVAGDGSRQKHCECANSSYLLEIATPTEKTNVGRNNRQTVGTYRWQSKSRCDASKLCAYEHLFLLPILSRGTKSSFSLSKTIQGFSICCSGVKSYGHRTHDKLIMIKVVISEMIVIS